MLSAGSTQTYLVPCPVFELPSPPSEEKRQRQWIQSEAVAHFGSQPGGGAISNLLTPPLKRKAQPFLVLQFELNALCFMVTRLKICDSYIGLNH